MTLPDAKSHPELLALYKKQQAEITTLRQVLTECLDLLEDEYPRSQWQEYYPAIIRARMLLGVPVDI